MVKCSFSSQAKGFILVILITLMFCDTRTVEETTSVHGEHSGEGNIANLEDQNVIIDESENLKIKHQDEVSEYETNMSPATTKAENPDNILVPELDIESSTNIDTSNELPSQDAAYDSKDTKILNSGVEYLNNSSIDNSTTSGIENKTEVNVTSTSNITQIKKATCLEMEDRKSVSDVEIINSTTLQGLLQVNFNFTNRSSPAQCYLIYFFSPYCPFSIQGSPYVNALARTVPNIPVYGLNSVEYHSINAWYGVMGTPSLVLFHNGNVAGRYNGSEYATFYLESFIRHFTNQEIYYINVTSLDFKAKLPTKLLTYPPYALYLAWAFLLSFGAWIFFNSEFYAKFTEAFVDNWREAEAQHEHVD